MVAGVVGVLFKRFLDQKYQEPILKASGLAVMFMGLSGTLAAMFSVDDGGSIAISGTLLMVLSIVFGAIVGEIIDIEAWFERCGYWLKRKTGSAKDALFVDGFVTASLTVSIGAMAIIGAIQDGIYGDYTLLATKALLDFVIITIMTASMGKGCAFSAIPVFVLQGSITLLAHGIEPLMTDAVLTNISLVGNILIVAVGMNLIWPKLIRVANLLPALVFAVALTFVPFVANL